MIHHFNKLAIRNVGQGGVEYLLLLSVVIAVAAIVTYYVFLGYSSAASSASGATVKAALSASKVGMKPWYNTP